MARGLIFLSVIAAVPQGFLASGGVRAGDGRERRALVQTPSFAAILPRRLALDVEDRWGKLCGTGPPAWADLGAGRCAEPSFRSLSRRAFWHETLNTGA